MWDLVGNPKTGFLTMRLIQSKTGNINDANLTVHPGLVVFKYKTGFVIMVIVINN